MDDSPLKKISTYWPLIVSALALTVTAASANTRLDNLKDRVDYIYANGPPSQADRLARIETKQENVLTSLDNINSRLDEIQENQQQLYESLAQNDSSLKKMWKPYPRKNKLALK